jgi:phage terminase small subunit
MRRANTQQDLFADAPIWDEGLTGRQRRFVELYCTDKGCFLNAVKAFAKAYGRPGKEVAEASAQSNAARLMRQPNIKEAAARLLRSAQNDEDRLSEFQALKLLKTLAFYSPADIVDKYGRLKAKESLEELGEAALCVAGIKRNRDGSNEIKLYDRTKALAMLCEYLKITRPPEGVAIVNPNVYLADKDIEEMRPAEPAAEEAEYEVMGAE